MMLARVKKDTLQFFSSYRYQILIIAGLVVTGIFYLEMKAKEQTATHVYHHEAKSDYKDGRILNSQSEALFEGKERLLSKVIQNLEFRIAEMEKGKTDSIPSPSVTPAAAPSSSIQEPEPEPVRLSPPPEVPVYSRPRLVRRYSLPTDHLNHDSREIVSFPVKDTAIEKVETVTLPSGSYVRGKLMTGVEAPEGKTFPVLIQLDYAYIVPNQHRLDLSGCFMIVKSEGDLSTERVQMQASKISCVSKSGQMFEREISGFVADDKDNSFAVMGKVNSKQDRVAAMAFLSSVVEGVGKAIQSAQTTQQTTPLGGTQSVVTGDQMKYITSGGAANAATMVTQWYLKQAQNLLPTINVGSGQDVWVIMTDSVRLPNEYFQRNFESGGKNGEPIFTYFTRIVD